MMFYIWLVVTIIAFSYTVATSICMLLMPLARRRYYRFGLEPSEPLAIANVEELAKRSEIASPGASSPTMTLAKRHQLRDLELESGTESSSVRQSAEPYGSSADVITLAPEDWWEV